MTITALKSLRWLLLLPLLAVACKDDDPELAPIDQLPPATQTGEYTFGCLVNGEAFVPESTRDMRAIYQRGILQVSASTTSEIDERGIGIDIYSTIEVGRSYDLTNEPFEAAEYGVGGVDIANCRYEEEETLSGTLTITHFDDEEYIISGTFEFTTATEGCDTIRVTDGRFDLPYIP